MSKTPKPRIKKFAIPRQLSAGKTNLYGQSSEFGTYSTTDISPHHPKPYQTRTKATDQTAYLQAQINARKTQQALDVEPTQQSPTSTTAQIQAQINAQRNK